MQSSLPDHVFDPGYRLQPLSEVKRFVEEYHHLPDIPSAAEVKEKGMSVGGMEAKLLGKIEELTLHMIEAEERNQRLEKEIALLKKSVSESQATQSRAAGER